MKTTGKNNKNNKNNKMKTIKIKQAVICGLALMSTVLQTQACKINDWRACNPDPTGTTVSFVGDGYGLYSATITLAHIITCVDAADGQAGAPVCDAPTSAFCRETVQYTPPDLHSVIKILNGNSETTQTATGETCQ